jgi:hypothetical protein
MSATADDHLIDEWFRQVKADERAKSRLATAIRSKNEDALRSAVVWVLENLIKPGVKAVWDSVIKVLIRSILGG